MINDNGTEKASAYVNMISFWPQTPLIYQSDIHNAEHAAHSEKLQFNI